MKSGRKPNTPTFPATPAILGALMAALLYRRQVPQSNVAPPAQASLWDAARTKGEACGGVQ